MPKDLSQPAGLTDILDSLIELSGEQGIAIGDIIGGFRHRSFGPLILVPALVVLLPTGMIPGVPTVMALCIILITIQMLLAREAPWLPQCLARLSIQRDTFRNGVNSARGVTMFVDRYIHTRFEWFTSEMARRLTAALCLVLAVSIIPLEVIPFAAAVPAVCIVLMSLGVSTEDGLLVVIGLITLGAGAVLVWTLL